jgi:hypothetical protein
VACGLVGFELSEGLGTDVSSEAQIRKLQSYWVSTRRSAATELARFPNETDKVVPALVKALADPDTEVRIRAMESARYGYLLSPNEGQSPRPRPVHPARWATTRIGGDTGRTVRVGRARQSLASTDVDSE